MDYLIIPEMAIPLLRTTCTCNYEQQAAEGTFRVAASRTKALPPTDTVPLNTPPCTTICPTKSLPSTSKQ
ncbi:unnamed protein product, partial [Iphiclides podalirius]